MTWGLLRTGFIFTNKKLCTLTSILLHFFIFAAIYNHSKRDVITIHSVMDTQLITMDAIAVDKKIHKPYEKKNNIPFSPVKQNKLKNQVVRHEKKSPITRNKKTNKKNALIKTKQHKPINIKKKTDHEEHFKSKTHSELMSQQNKLTQNAKKELANLSNDIVTQKNNILNKEQEQVNHYALLLKSSISSQWSYPINTSKYMKTTVNIKLMPNGSITNINIIETSGNSDFDASVLNAIKLAEPFDFLSNLNILVFERHFRTVIITFTPGSLIER